MKGYNPQITMLKVEIKDKNESVLTVDLSDEFVEWFKITHNLKRWAPKQFKQWLIKVLEGDTR
jgi:hypothetical protein|tara:strand:- start:247 stop:435 length:189 start_codon:yes stop_codon:yes gene_type:complete